MGWERELRPGEKEGMLQHPARHDPPAHHRRFRPIRRLFHFERLIHAEHVVPGHPLWVFELTEQKIGSSSHQLNDKFPRTALTGLREKDAKGFAISKLLHLLP